MNLIINITLYILANTFGLILLKKSLLANSLSRSNYIDLLFNARFVIGFLLYATSFGMWILLLSKKDLSFIYPMVVGLSYIAILAVSVIVLEEQFTSVKLIASLLIGTGIFLLAIYK